jgi:hypothetical protein
MATVEGLDSTKLRPKPEDEFLMQFTVALYPVSIYIYMLEDFYPKVGFRARLFLGKMPLHKSVP